MYGVATITVKAKEGTASNTCKVTVKEDVIEVTKVTLNKTSATIEKNEELKLVATVEPTNAGDKSITWESSNPDVATVNNGIVKGLTAGNTTITARSSNGKTATCNVTVKVVLISSITINESNVELSIGEGKGLTGTILPDDVTEKEVEWTSDNTSVVTVNNNGYIVGKKAGTATITVKAKVGDAKATCRVIVKADVIEVTGVTLDKKNITIDTGDEEKLTATVQPTNAGDKSVTWESSNPSVATVTNGTVKGIKAGTATITVRTSNGKTATCSVTVNTKIIEPTGVTLNKTIATILRGEELKLTAIVKPTNANDRSVTWESSNPSVATVTNGVVKGLSEGNTTITAKTSNGKTATCNVTVNIVLINSITLTDKNITISCGEGRRLTGTILPDNVTEKEVEWSSSNESIVIVSDEGFIAGCRPGTATITVKAKKGTASDTCTVTVLNDIIEVTGVTLDKTSTTIEKGTKLTLVATVQPTNAADKTVTWSSSDPSVATVTNGVVKALKKGSTTITVKTANGKTATCNISVIASSEIEPTAIQIDYSYSEIVINGTNDLQFKVKYTPENANTNTAIEWKTSDTSKATINQSGVINPIANGNVTITAKTANGKTATKQITINTAPKSISLSSTTLNLDKTDNKTGKLTVSYEPNTSNVKKKIEWTTSDSKVATVNDSGTVTAVSNGKAIITATTENNKKATCTVNIVTSPSGISLSPTSTKLDLINKKTQSFNYTITPSSANTNKTVEWKIANGNIASVDGNGLVTAKANGSTTLTIKTKNGKEATATITVETPASVTVSPTSLTLDMSGTKTGTISAVIGANSSISDKTITWTSSNEKVAKVDKNGKVTGVANGSATITATLSDKTTKASAKVTVQTSPTAIYFETNHTDSTKYETITKGSSKTIAVKYEPSTANANKTVIYSLSNGNPLVAEVTDKSKGAIKGKQAGVMKLNAKTSKGLTASIYVNVRIGNSLVNVKNIKTSKSESLIYSKCTAPFSSGYNMQPQSFDIDSNNAIFYAGTEPKTGEGKSYISRYFKASGANTRPTGSGMELVYNGHQSAIDVEEDGKKRYIWGQTFASAQGSNGWTKNYAVSRIPFSNDVQIMFGPGKVVEKNAKKKKIKDYSNVSASNFVYVKKAYYTDSTSSKEIADYLVTSMDASLDEDQGIVCIYFGDYYFIYDLNELLALPNATYSNLPIEVFDDLNKGTTKKEYLDIIAKNIGWKDGSTRAIEPLATINATKSDISGYRTDSMQGIDLDGDYVYMVEGKSHPTHITGFDYMFNYNGKKPVVNREMLYASTVKAIYKAMGDSTPLSDGTYSFRETEGIKVKNGVLYVGFGCKNDGHRRATILKIPK